MIARNGECDIIIQMVKVGDRDFLPHALAYSDANIKPRRYPNMSKKDIHVSKTEGGDWQAKKVGAQRASNISSTQSEAAKAATKIAKREGTEVFIHGRDGKIRERNSFGNDPFPPKG